MQSKYSVISKTPQSSDVTAKRQSLCALAHRNPFKVVSSSRQAFRCCAQHTYGGRSLHQLILNLLLPLLEVGKVDDRWSCHPCFRYAEQASGDMQSVGMLDRGAEPVGRCYD